MTQHSPWASAMKKFFGDAKGTVLNVFMASWTVEQFSAIREIMSVGQSP